MDILNIYIFKYLYFINCRFSKYLVSYLVEMY